MSVTGIERVSKKGTFAGLVVRFGRVLGSTAREFLVRREMMRHVRGLSERDLRDIGLIADDLATIGDLPWSRRAQQWVAKLRNDRAGNY